MTWVQGTSRKCHELEDEEAEKGTCGETVSMDIKISEEGQQHCAETYRCEKSCAASRWEEQMPLEPVNAAYLDAIDNEINILVQTDDLDEVGKQSKSGPNGFQETRDHGKATTPEEESHMEDIENDSFDIQLNGINPREDVGLEDATFELAIQTGYSPVLMSEELNGVERGNSSTPVADNKGGEERTGRGSNKLETHGIVGEQLSVISSVASESECPAEVAADELIDQTVAAANTVTPTSPELYEAAEAAANKEELFAIDIPENDSSAAESVKCVTYEYERSSPEAEESTLNSFSRGTEVSATADGSIGEYRVSASHEDVGRLTDRSPLLCRRKSEDGRASAEETDSEKPRTPFLNFLKEEVGVKESAEKEGLLLQKKTAKESSKKSTSTTSSITREKQKHRTSLFSSCMCCTTAIN